MESCDIFSQKMICFVRSTLSININLHFSHKVTLSMDYVHFTHLIRWIQLDSNQKSKIDDFFLHTNHLEEIFH